MVNLTPSRMPPPPKKKVRDERAKRTFTTALYPLAGLPEYYERFLSYKIKEIYLKPRVKEVNNTALPPVLILLT
jgi:hypothetical protein